MPLYRGFALALSLVAVAAGASVFIPRAAQSSPPPVVKAEPAAQTIAQRNLPNAMAALTRLKVPGNFHRLQAGCRWYRCYVVADPTRLLAPALSQMMGSVGALNPDTGHLQAAVRSLSVPLERLTDSTVRAHLVGCSRANGVTCAYPTVIHHNVVDFVLAPRLPCQGGRCRSKQETDVEVSFPSGASMSR